MNTSTSDKLITSELNGAFSLFDPGQRSGIMTFGLQSKKSIRLYPVNFSGNSVIISMSLYRTHYPFSANNAFIFGYIP